MGAELVWVSRCVFVWKCRGEVGGRTVAVRTEA